MNSFVSKFGVTLAALALVIAPVLASAQTSALAVSITSPADNANVTLNQATSFTAQATGGTGPITYTWTFSEGNPLTGVTVSKAFTSAGTKTITVEAADRNTTKTATIRVVVGSGTTDNKPVISNIQKTVTQTTATITWVTKDASGADLAATSRVIYGTVSHKDPVTGKETGTAPNYDYTNSEPTSVNSGSPKVVNHSVTLTGLTPGTKYYFRVLSAR